MAKSARTIETSSSKLSRRAVLGGICATTLAADAVAAEAAADAHWQAVAAKEQDTSLAALETLIEQFNEAHRALDEKSDNLNAADALLIGRRPPVRVQVGKMSVGFGDAGERIFKPIYAGCDWEIDARRQQDLDIRLTMTGGRADLIADAHAGTSAWADAKKAELATIDAQARQIEREVGFDVAEREWDEAHEHVLTIEGAILDFVPTSMPAIVRKCAWLVTVLPSFHEGSSVEDRLMRGLQAMAEN